MPPAEAKPEDHPAANFERSEVVNVSSFRDSNALMKGNGTLQNGELMSERRVEEMAIKLQVNARIKQTHHSPQRFSVNDFVCRSYISESALSKMLAFEELTSEEVSVIHKG